jgi:hypothetical protein
MEFTLTPGWELPARKGRGNTGARTKNEPKRVRYPEAEDFSHCPPKRRPHADTPELRAKVLRIAAALEVSYYRYQKDLKDFQALVPLPDSIVETLSSTIKRFLPIYQIGGLRS